MSCDTRLGRPSRRRLRSLALFWTLHGTWGLVVALPVTLVQAWAPVVEPLRLASTPARCGDLAFVAWLGLWLAGFVLESWADHVKLCCRRTRACAPASQAAAPAAPAAYFNMDGHVLWRFTRNPNFLGETLCWLGLAGAAACELVRLGAPLWAQLAVWLSPLFTLAIMLFEAVLLSERKNFRRFGSAGTPAFFRYRRRTSLLWPCPPVVYERLPMLLKRLVFMEWDMYRYDHTNDRRTVPASMGAKDKGKAD